MKRYWKGMLSTYAELHRHSEEEFDIKVSAEVLWFTLIRDFDYNFGKIANDKNSIRITYQNRRFFDTVLKSVLSQFRFILCANNVCHRCSKREEEKTMQYCLYG